MIIYKTTNLINNKIYIGQDIKDNPKYLGSGLLLKKSINKYGKLNFVKETIEVCENKQILNEREIFWIEELNSRNTKIGYNIAEGGFGGNTYTEETKKRVSDMLKGRHVSDETKEKMSKSRLGVQIHTSESKSKISQTHKGKKLSQEHIDIIRKNSKTSLKSEEFLKNIGNILEHRPKGSKHTQETKDKMSEYHKNNPVKYWSGKKRPIEVIEKAKKSNMGFKHTEEHKIKISGDGNYFYGKKHSDETKKKMSDLKTNKTPEQKLETYRKFYLSRTGNELNEEQLRLKLKEIKKNEF